MARIEGLTGSARANLRTLRLESATFAHPSFVLEMSDRTLLSAKPISPRDRLIFALDVPTPEEALQVVDQLGEEITFYKLGLQLFMTPGYFSLVDELKRRGKRIFVDLKFFDVPETVKNAVANLAKMGVDCCTVHGSQAILEGAVQAKGG